MSGKITEQLVKVESKERLASMALTKPQHIREAASILFNRFNKKWGPGATASQVRALASLLNLARVAMTDVEFEERLSRMEAQLARPIGNTASTAGTDSNGNGIRPN